MRWLLILIPLPFLALGGLYYHVTDDGPMLAPPEAGSSAAQAGLKDLLSLKNLRAAAEGQVALGEADLSRALHEAVSSAGGGIGSARVAMGAMYLRASLPAPLSRYLNVELVLSPSGEFLAPEALTVGSVSVPANMVRPATQWALEQSGHAAAFQAAMQKLQGAAIQGQGLVLRLTPEAMPALAGEALKQMPGAEELMREGMQALQSGQMPVPGQGAAQAPALGQTPGQKPAGVMPALPAGMTQEALKEKLKEALKGAGGATPPGLPPGLATGAAGAVPPPAVRPGLPPAPRP